MNNYFKTEKEKKEDIINKYFDFKNENNDYNIEENYYGLKRKLFISNELKNDIKTVELILNLFLLNANLLIKNYRDIRILKNQLFLLLKNHDTFRYFFYNNKINDDILLKIIPHLKYRHITKNKIICKEGEDSLYMYFILKGNISLIKDSINLNEMNIIKENDNFGHWDMIYHRKRKSTYYSLDECHIIIIDKDIFRRYLQEKIIKGDDELKSFVTKFLNKNGISAFFRIERIIHNMQLLYYRKDEIIYEEGEINKNIYLIYKGEGKLVKKIEFGEFYFVENLKENTLKIQKKAKNINYKEFAVNEINELDSDNNKKSNNNNNNKKMLLDKSEYKILSILGKGNIGGLEISTGIKNKKYTFVSNSDYTTIIKIELMYIQDNINQFMLNLLSLFIKSEREIHARIKRIRYIDNIISENCQKYKYKNDKSNDNTFSLYDNDKKFIKEIKKISNQFEVNDGGFIKMNDFNINLNLKKNKLKEQLIESKKKNIKINILMKEYDKKEENNNKYKEVKMLGRPHTINQKINKYINFIEDYNISSNKCVFKSQTNKIFENKKINIRKKMSQKYYADKTLENFEEIIENYRNRNTAIDVYNPQIIKTERSIERKRSLENIKIENKLLKEIIIINKKNCNTIKEYKSKNKDQINMRKRNIYNKSIKNALNRRYKTIDGKCKNKIFIINKKILRKLFEKNMIKKERNLDIKCTSFSERRMIYYNTGMYDMPFVSHLNSKNK